MNLSKVDTMQAQNEPAMADMGHLSNSLTSESATIPNSATCFSEETPFHDRSRPSAPDLWNSSDRERIERLIRSVTVKVSDVAWLYGTSVETIYAQCRSNVIKNKRLGDRFLVFSQPLFAELFPITDGQLPPMPSTNGKGRHPLSEDGSNC